MEHFKRWQDSAHADEKLPEPLGSTHFIEFVSGERHFLGASYRGSLSTRLRHRRFGHSI